MPMHDQQPQALEVVRLEKVFDSKAVLRSLELSVECGMVLAFVGRNGAGKTTALRCIAGHLPRDAGDVFVNGVLQRRGPTRGVAYLPELPSVYAGITVWDHLQFVATGRSVRDWRTKAEELLRKLRFLEYRDHLGYALSKGTRQKLLVACAVLSDAQYLLLDEPLVGLDPVAQDDFVQVIGELAAGGRGVIFSTHNLDVALRLGSRVAVLKDGCALPLARNATTRDELLAAL